jgi:hypothetical protein
MVYVGWSCTASAHTWSPWMLPVRSCCRGGSATPVEFLRSFGELEPQPVEVVFEATSTWPGAMKRQRLRRADVNVCRG